MTDAGDPLEGVLIGGREQVPIVIVDYDEQWPHRYAALRERVLAALGPAALRVEHIGSTSVPGLAAKPIIDVLVTVQSVDDEPAFVPAMQGAGFVLRVREPEHRMFRTPARDAHVHLYEPDHTAVDAYLVLRDWLRVDADDRELYGRTKCELATRTWTDMNEYADAKTDVISTILVRAREWRARQATDEPSISLLRWEGPRAQDDPDANFKAEVADYCRLDPLVTLQGMSRNLDIPVGALARYVLARWATAGSGGLLELGPQMVRRLWEPVARAEAAGNDDARLAAYAELRGLLSWLKVPLDDPSVYGDRALD